MTANELGCNMRYRLSKAINAGHVHLWACELDHSPDTPLGWLVCDEGRLGSLHPVSVAARTLQRILVEGRLN
jgi:hypothetical protein